MNASDFRRWLQRQSAQLSQSDPDVADFEDAGSVIAEARQMSLDHNFPGAYQVVAGVRNGPLGIGLARSLLSEMINALPTSETGPFSVVEVADRLGVSKRHVYDLIHEGKLETLPGKPIRITQEAIEAYRRPPLKRFKHL